MKVLIGLLLLQLTGSEVTYSVKPGESLTRIGARFGVDVRVLASANGLKADSFLRIGQQLKVNNRHIVPSFDDADIVINVPQRMLFFRDNETVKAYPIAAGRSTWRTPTGAFTVATKEADPTWVVPPSIQEEMRRENKPVLTRVPPCDQNPLGGYWIGLNMPGVGIHGTNIPATIYSLVTHGCIRLRPDDITELFAVARIGTRVRIVYEPVLIDREGSAVFLEVHPDAYKEGADPLKTVVDQATADGFVEMLDLSLVRKVILARDGIARDVARH